jgi:hypothetical protein
MEIISRSYSTTTSSPVDPKMFDDMVKYVELNFNSIGINKCDIEIDNKISNVLYDYLSKSNPEPSNRAVNLFWLVKLYGKDNNNYIFYLGRSYTNRSKSDIVINGNHIKIDKVFVQWFENNIDMSKCELNH